jgi:hypothetical protein
LPYPRNILRPFEVVPVLRFFLPFLLTQSLARLAACRLCAEPLPLPVPRIRLKQPLAMTTFYLYYESHSPGPFRNRILDEWLCFLKKNIEEKNRKKIEEKD